MIILVFLTQQIYEGTKFHDLLSLLKMELYTGGYGGYVLRAMLQEQSTFSDTKGRPSIDVRISSQIEVSFDLDLEDFVSIFWFGCSLFLFWISWVILHKGTQVNIG